jgi:hypothetical protein
MKFPPAGASILKIKQSNKNDKNYNLSQLSLADINSIPQLQTSTIIGHWSTCDWHLYVVIHEGLLAFLGEDMSRD